jgi:predicted dienelactone hydrolase
MQKIKNICLPAEDNHPVVLDIFFEEATVQQPVVIYAHGFNGFKDWGNFDLIAEKFAERKFVFIKFNFSHNGTTPAHPEEFADLEAFGNNNYSTELKDIRGVVDWVCSTGNPYRNAIDSNRIYLIGHSMGGGIAILHAAKDERIKRLVTWASISQCKTPWANWTVTQMDEWKQSGVQYYTNSRTKQQMPLYYQLYEDYTNNMEALDIEKAIQHLAIPVLICHGTADAAVPIQNAWLLKGRQPAAQLFTVDSDHVFGRKHPWTERALPAAMDAIVSASIQFLL